jgi:hypothetical protein
MMERKDGRDRRTLVESVFGSPLADGKPAGVYVSPAGGGRDKITYELRGALSFRLMSSARG